MTGWWALIGHPTGPAKPQYSTEGGVPNLPGSLVLLPLFQKDFLEASTPAIASRGLLIATRPDDVYIHSTAIFSLQ